MKYPNVAIAERPQNSHASQSQHGFLAKPVALIAAVKKIGNTPIRGIVLLQIGVEKNQWHLVSGDSTKHILPGTHAHSSTFNENGDGGRHTRKMLFRRPLDWA